MSVPVEELRHELTTLLTLVRELNARLPELKTKTQDVTFSLQKASAVAYGVMGIMKQLGLPPPFDEATLKIQRMIMLLNQLRITIHLVEIAAGPVGWALAGISIVGTAATLPDQIGSLLG